jgi:two-component system, NarL family, response regulator NreC
MKKIGVELIDDHAVVRAGVRMLIEYQADMEVVAEAANAVDGVRLARELRPDIVLLDIGLPGCSGLDAIGPVLEASPKSKILILSTHDNQAYLRLALTAGAAGYVAKEASASELTQAIRTVAAGRSYVNVSLAGNQALKSLLETRRQAGTSPLDELSAREKQVLALIASGHTNKEVADELGLSVKSIETYRHRVVEKLGLSSRADLVRFALQAGLIASSGGPESGA